MVIISPILRTSTWVLTPLLLVVSIFLLLRGHNEPGGGFVGGLIAAAAFALIAIAYDVERARRYLWMKPHHLVGIGLLLALLSGIFALVAGKAFLTGLWVELTLPTGRKLALGTPMLFDLGVYAIVLGVLMTIILNLAEE